MNFDFSYNDYEKLKERCPFSDDELLIFGLKRRNYSNLFISLEYNIPLRTVERRVKDIKRKILKELDKI